jgi:hypothetical protein
LKVEVAVEAEVGVRKMFLQVQVVVVVEVVVEEAVHMLRHDGGFELAQCVFQLKSQLL